MPHLIYKDKERFVLGVQWHPERSHHYDNDGQMKISDTTNENWELFMLFRMKCTEQKKSL